MTAAVAVEREPSSPSHGEVGPALVRERRRRHPGSRLARAINRHHAACREADRAALGHALRAGELLIQAKAELRQGEWGAWVADHCAFAARTAQLYMQLARFAQENPHPVAHLTLSECIHLVRQSPEGPPYGCRPPRFKYTIGFTCLADFNPLVRLPHRHPSPGHP